MSDEITEDDFIEMMNGYIYPTLPDYPNVTGINLALLKVIHVIRTKTSNLSCQMANKLDYLMNLIKNNNISEEAGLVIARGMGKLIITLGSVDNVKDGLEKLRMDMK